jgi:hypothetical protein
MFPRSLRLIRKIHTIQVENHARPINACNLHNNFGSHARVDFGSANQPIRFGTLGNLAAIFCNAVHVVS